MTGIKFPTPQDHDEQKSARIILSIHGNGRNGKREDVHRKNQRKKKGT